jgi:ketosteroid isomerase-like protein
LLSVAVALALFAARSDLAVASHRDRDVRAVQAVEDEITAALSHNDADALDRLWAPDYTFVNPAGVLLTKAAS